MSESIISSSSDSSEKAELASTKGKSVTINGNDRSMDLNEHDVVCEKGRGDHERWPGNKLYRHLINVNKESYNDLAPIERSNIIGSIINTIQEKDGWFVNHSDQTGKWARLTEEKVRKKVSDDLRREVRRRREKRSHNSLFSAKLRAIKEMEEEEAAVRDILEPVNDPRQTDVLFGPGARRHPGNKTYWNFMKLNLDQYIISPYGARSVISRNIVQGVRTQHGRFLEQDPKTGIWYSISDKRAIEKTSHALSNMKYKTRKRFPDEPDHPHHQGHIAYRVGPYEEFMYDEDDEDDDSEEEKILEGDSPNTIFAKKRTKKFRLLRRMDDDDDETLESKESLKSAAGDKMKSNKAVLPTTPPQPGMNGKEPGKMISPNDSRASMSVESREDFHEFQEQRNPNSFGNFRRVASGMPGDSAAYSGDLVPRLTSHYDSYLKGYGGGALGNGASAGAYKNLAYGGMREDYVPPIRRYLSDYVASRNGTPGVNVPIVHPGLHEAASPYDGLNARRRVLKGTGPGGYWVSNDWVRMNEYY